MRTVLFFDDWALHRSDNLVRRMGRPKRMPEADWDDPILNQSPNFITAFKEGSKWRMFYCAVPLTEKQDHGSRLFTAESDDGLHWEPVRLPKGHTKESHFFPHCVLTGEHSAIGAQVYRDGRDAKWPWKVPYVDATRGRAPRQCLAVSADGYRWEVLPQQFHIRNSDTGNNIFFNQYTGRYQIIGRDYHAQRLIASIETPDFAQYDRPRIVLRPDPLDPPLVQFYGMPTFAYEGHFIGLLWLQHMDPAELKATRMLGTIDTHLAYSYDGDSFQRTFRAPFLERGAPGEAHSGTIYGFHLMEPGDGTLRIYAKGQVYEHAYRSLLAPDGEVPGVSPRNPSAGLDSMLAYSLRKDGFMYLESYSHVGSLMTRPFDLTEPGLSINLQAPHGEAAVQLRDSDGHPIPGFTFAESILLHNQDSLAWDPQWQEHPSLEPLVGMAVRVEIKMARARLYAIRIGGTLRDRNVHIHSGA